MTAKSSAYLISSLLCFFELVVAGTARAQQTADSTSQPTAVPALSHFSTDATSVQGAQSSSSDANLLNTAVGNATSGSNVTFNSPTVIDFGSLAGGTLDLHGQNFVNYSTVYAVSSNPALSQAIIQAGNVYIAPGALLTTVLPAGGLPGYSNLVSSLSLSVVASNSIVNSGVLSSSANLSLTAPQIYNGSTSNSTAVISAVNNVNFYSGNILNSGLITSMLSNINVSSITSQNIVFNNMGGVLEALRGNVNFRDSLFVGKYNTDILGGSILAQSLNIFSGNGYVNIDVSTLGNEQAPSVLNIVTGEAAVKVGGAINLGHLVFQGDPIVIAENGDIHLIADQNGSGPLHVIAENGSIINDSCTSIIGTGDITYRASGSILLQGIQQISTNGIISLEAEGGSLIAPEAQISTTAVPSYYVPAGPVSGVIPYSVQLFAQNSIEVGSITNPAGVVVVRGGGRTEDGIHYPSTNPGSVVVGNINVSSSDPGRGGIVVDNFGGSVTTGALNGNGSRIQIQSSESVSIISPDNKIAAIVNDGSLIRTGQYFQADTIINAPVVNVSGPSLMLNDGSTFIGSVVQLGQTNIAVEKIFASNTLGGGVMFQATSGSVKLDCREVQATNTGKSFSNFNVLAAHGALEISAPLAIHAEALTAGTNGGGVSLVGTTALNTKDSIWVTAFGDGSGKGGAIKLSGGDNSTFQGQNILLDARGGSAGNGGSISIISGTGLSVDANSITVAAGANGSGGYILLDASSDNPGTNLLVTGGPLNADGNGVGDGGTIRLINGQSKFTIGSSGANAEGVIARSGLLGGNGGSIFIESGGDLNVEMSGVATGARGTNGDGGNLFLISGMRGDPSDPLSPLQIYDGHLKVNGPINVDGAGNGYGGVVYLVNGQSPFSIGGNNADISSVSAQAGANGGGGGYLYARSGGDLNVLADSIQLGASLNNGDGGLLSLSAGLSNPDANLNISGILDLSGKGSGAGGQLEISAGVGKNGNLLMQGDYSASASQGKGGTINLSAGGDLIGTGALNLSTRSETAAGSILLSSGRDTSIADLVIDAGSSTGNGGSVSLSAANLLSFSGNVSADSQSGNAGAITLAQGSGLDSMKIGISSSGEAVSALLSASSQSGKSGSISISSKSGSALLVDLNQSLRAVGSDGLGQVSVISKESVNLQGPGSFVGALTGSASSFHFAVGGKSSIIGIGANLASSQGDLVVTAGAGDSKIALSGSSLSAKGGNLELGAANISVNGSNNISLDNAGLIQIDSGSQSNSLDLELAPGAVLNFIGTQGQSLRPGLVEIGPTGNGSLSIHSEGTAALEFAGVTTSMFSSGGDINLGQNLAINSDAYDSSQNIGMELLSTNGNVNINSSISARQLNVSTLGSGDINLGADINSPTVVLSVQGNSSIRQTGIGSIGIGTLVVSSQSGDIGSVEKPLETNVLELQVHTSGSAYFRNASTVDLMSSSVAGTFQLANDGDVSMESSFNAGSLDINSSGSISIFNAVEGTNGVMLASAPGPTGSIEVAVGGALSASSGSIFLNTDNLVLDGSILAQSSGASVSVNSLGKLVLNGSNASISASGGNGLIELNGADGVDFGSSYSLNAGPSGTVRIQTTSLSGSGVSLANSSSMTVGGGSQLNILSNSLNLSIGSSINLSNSGNAMTVQSAAGSALTVSVTGSNSINNSTGTGTVSILAGLGGDLNFKNSSVGTGNLNINGAGLATSSTSANTNLSSVNLNSNRNIEIGVHGGTLNLNGNISSTQNNGVIVLRDPAGITINGGGTVGFAQGLRGLISVQALSSGADLQFSGNPHFDAGSGGSVSFESLGSITFAAGSSTTIQSGATLNICAPLINFGAGSQIVASGASNINISGYNSSKVDFVMPDANFGTIRTNGGGMIVIAAASGFDVNFHHNGGGASAATLNLLGGPVTIQTADANITIDPNVVVHADNNVSVLAPGGNFVNNGQLQSPNQGSSMIIEAAGPLIIDKNIVASSLIVRTTANNGTITLGADLNVKKELAVSANGSGNIKQTAGRLSAESIYLSSGSGNIGSSTDMIKVSTGHLTVSTAGSAYVSSQGSIRVDSYNVRGGLNLSAGGDITLGGENAKSLTINNNGTFNAGKSGTVTVAASDLISMAAGVSLKVQDSALVMNAGNIKLGNAAKVDSSGNLSLNGNVVGTDFELNSSRGNVQLNGDISGRNVAISTKNHGDIVFNGNLTASKLTVEADGRGNIIQASGLLSANRIVLESGRGNIGSVSSALNLSTAVLSANTGGTGIVNVRAIGNLTLENSGSGGNFSVAVAGNLTVSDVETERGSITLMGSGSVKIAQNAEIRANQGNLTVLNTDAENGSITIGRNAELIALSDSASNGLGNVRIAIGSVPTNPVKGHAPSGLKLSQKYGGQAYFGTNGISVNGKNNEVNAWGSNVIFSTGSRPRSAISLEGGVYILADPPVAGVGSSAPTQESTYVLGTPGDTVQFGNSARSYFPAFTNSAGFALNTPNSCRSTESGKIQEDSEMKAVACVSSLSGTVLEGSVVKSTIKRSSTSTSCVYTSSGGYERTESSLTFFKGEMMVNALHQTEVKVGNKYKIRIAPGAVVLIKSESGEGIEVYNIYERRWGGVKISVVGREFVLGVGQRLLAEKESLVAARNEKSHRIADKTIKVAEFPLVSLIANSDLLAKFVRSPVKEDRQLGIRLMKMAACLSLVTASHGVYKN